MESPVPHSKTLDTSYQSVTLHELRVNDKVLAYTATAGSLNVMDDNARAVGNIFEEDIGSSLADPCRACQPSAEHVLELVVEGIVEPIKRNSARWRFRGISLRRPRCVQRLERDPGANVAGAPQAIDLLEQLGRLRARLRRLEG
jgi:chaperone modulatory protein CbpM